MNKTVKRLTIALLVITPLMVVLAFAQTQQEPGRERMMRMKMREAGVERQMLPDLTEEQKEKMKELKLKVMEESLPLKNQLNENKAKYRTLSTASEVDMKAIDKLVEESGKLETELKKKAAVNHQEIRKILTDEQRIIFDSRTGHRMGERMRRSRGGGAVGERRHLREMKSEN